MKPNDIIAQTLAKAGVVVVNVDFEADLNRAGLSVVKASTLGMLVGLYEVMAEEAIQNNPFIRRGFIN